MLPHFNPDIIHLPCHIYTNSLKMVCFIPKRLGKNVEMNDRLVYPPIVLRWYPVRDLYITLFIKVH